jgi:hypothetical protein
LLGGEGGGATYLELAARERRATYLELAAKDIRVTHLGLAAREEGQRTRELALEANCGTSEEGGEYGASLCPAVDLQCLDGIHG